MNISHTPMIAQFRVLGMRSVSHSTTHPQCTLNALSQMRYIEYALLLLPSPPRFSDSAKSACGSGNDGVDERSNFMSNAQEQHGIEMYPEAP